MREHLQELLRRSQTLAWGLTILLLPLTSVSLVADLSGARTVAPAAALPLLWLCLVWLVPYLVRGGRLPRLCLPWLGFALVALLASAWAFFIEVPSFRGQTIPAQEMQALLTLGVGAAFYLVAVTWPRDEKRLALTLKLVNWSGATILLWSLLQAYVIWGQGGAYPSLMVSLQKLVSVRSLFSDRVTGFAFEPSWLAHQLNMLWLPFWLAAMLQRTSAHRLRLAGLTVENLLLAGGVLTLLSSLSRVGILAFLLVVTYLYLRASGRLIRRLEKRLRERQKWPRMLRRARRLGLWAGGYTLALVFLLAAAVGLVYGLSRFDARLEILFDPELYATGNFFAFTNRLAFAERVIYWATGWEIFNDHPFLGVGLGNAGFFFPAKMPAYGWGLWETGLIFYRLSFLPNTKSMWVRVLTETGILGFAFFLTWLYLLWAAARNLQRHASAVVRTYALAGVFTLIAFLAEGFSIDSFALPYLWVSTGLLSAAWGYARRAAPPVH